MSDPDPADLAAFAGEVQKLAGSGDFNPFAMFSETLGFHAVFLAPFSPALTSAIARFLSDGGGPLQQAVDALRSQGMAEPEARAKAREMFAAAKGMCVVVVSGGTALDTIPQLFFGNLSEEWRAHAVASCGDKFPGKEGLRSALADLDAKARGGTTWPALVAGPSAGSNLMSFWLELAAGIVASVDEGIMPVARDRLADLAHWTAAAGSLILAQGKRADGDDLSALARCRLLAGETDEAAALLDAIIARTGDEALDDEELLELVQHYANACARLQRGAVGAEWIGQRLPSLEARFGRSYEIVLALFNLLAA
ncbi:MAG: hypothetical protein H0W83_01600, partial [Planctomycetes bacterium]|nr:hypothetical protein [Planctomycetota bacterium]